MSLTNIALNSRSMNGQIVLSDGVAIISEGNIDCEDINSASLNTDNINTNLLNVTGNLECNSAGPYNIPTSISSETGLLIGYGNATNSGATDFLNFQSTYTSTQGGFRFWNKSNTQTLTNLAIIDNTQTYFKSQLVGCLAESPVNPTSVVNKTYVDNNFVYKTGSVTENINGLKTFTNNTNFTSSLLARTNLTLYEWDNQTGNTLTLLFPMKQIIALRISSGTTMAVQLPALTANERGMVFTFVKTSTNFNVTFNTTASNLIFPLNNLTGSPITNSTIFPDTKRTCMLAVGWFGTVTYWIEVSPYSTFDIDQNNLLYARLASPNAFTGTNTFNTSLPTSTLTPSSDPQLITKIFADQTYMSLTLSQTKSGTVNFLNQITFNGGSGGGAAIVCNNGLNANTFLNVAGTSTFSGNLFSNGEATFNTWVYLKFRTRIYDVSYPNTNYTNMYMIGNNEFVIGPNANGDFISFYCKDATLGQLQTFKSSALGNTSLVNLTCSASLITNNLTSPTTTSTNNIYTNLVAGGTINIGTLLSSMNVAPPTIFSSDITTPNIFCNDALYLNDYQPLPTPTTYSSILVQNTDILNFDANFNNNKFQFKVSSNAVLLLDATNTTIYNNLNSLSQASFSNFTPICDVASPTANNHLVRKDYVDNGFVDKTNNQTGIAGDKTFTGRLTNTFVIFAKDLSWLDAQGSGGRVQAYLSATDLGFISVNVNNNRYFFNTRDGAGTPTTPLLISSASTTISNTLYLNAGSRYYDTTNYTEFLQTGTQLTIKPVSNNGTLALYSTNLTGVQTRQLLIDNTGLTSTTLTSTNIFSSNYGTTTATGTTEFSFGTTAGIINIGKNITTGSINLGSATSTTNMIGILQFFHSVGNFSTIQQITSTLNIVNSTLSGTIKLQTRPSIGALEDTLTLNTTNCDILSPTLNLTSVSTINILTPNNLTGTINFLSSLTTATINFCSTAYTAIFNLNARIKHKQVQYLNEVKTISGTSATLTFPLEQRLMFTSTGATAINITLPELTATSQTGFAFSLFKTASNTNSVIFTCQGTNVIRAYNSITDLTTTTLLSGTGTIAGFFTAEISTGVFAWIVYL